MKNIRAAVALFLIATFLAGTVYATTSSVNPNVPAQNSPLSSSVLRGNFAAAENDLNTLFGIDTLNANQILGTVAAGMAGPLNLPSCGAGALSYTPGLGFGCNNLNGLVSPITQTLTFTGPLTFNGPIGGSSGASIIDNINYLSFTSTGTYTPSSGLVYAEITCVGGGGAGGGTTNSLSPVNVFLDGAGGGAGGWSTVLANSTSIGSSVAVNIGSGGLGATGTGASGSGGDTSVGTLCAAHGGGGGGGSGQGYVDGTAGRGGAIGTGSFAFPGSAGAGGCFSPAGGASDCPPATGANGPYGMGGVTTGQAVVAGGAAVGYGAGGGGATSVSTTTSYAGGNGDPGYVFIKEYLH